MSSLRALADASLPAIAAHVWSSTLFLLLVLIVVTAFRSRLTAASRFWLVLIGIAKFAVPADAVMRPLRSLFASATPQMLQIRVPAFVQQFEFRDSPLEPRLWPVVALGVWLVVTLAVLFRLGLTNRRLVALCIRTALPPAGREAEALTRARRRIGVLRSIDIARSAVAEAPAVLRIIRPLVVLPASGCDALSDQELESLLCHECAHVARHDNFIARVEALICALFWFHPLIWIAQRITVIERERACDEVVAESADERETYLTALTKFCHAAIAPRLPGVSCMATAKLRERIDHVMNYETLKAQAPSPRRVALAGAAALGLFTFAAGLIGTNALASSPGKADQSYAIKTDASRTGESITLDVTISDNSTQEAIGTAKLKFRAGQTANAHLASPGVDVLVEARPDSGDWVAVDVTITRNDKVVAKSRARVIPVAKEAESATYTGAPISMNLKDADLRNVIGTFGKLTGFDMRIDPSVQGTVSVNWVNVPWDQAFDSMLKDNGLTRRIEGKTIYISRK